VHGSAGNPDRQVHIALHERTRDTLLIADDLNHREAREDLFPDDPQLELCQPIADAAVDAVTERDVVARPLAIDDVGIRVSALCEDRFNSAPGRQQTY
jgi:hypothetical protein